METGVIIARFQTPFLHEGHLELIEKVKKNHQKIIVILGVAPIKGSKRNPFDYYTREKMIKKACPEIIILPLKDQPSDKLWSNNLDQLLSDTFSEESFLLYGSRNSFIPHYSGEHKTVELPEYSSANATDLREQFSQRTLDSEDFRAGILYAYHNQYPKVYATVDIAVFDNNKTQILLGKKANENKWRLPGGYSDPTDENFESAAIRELNEECGQMDINNLTYEGSFKIDDWRYRSETDKIFTTLFSCDFQNGEIIAKDDIDELKWFHISDVKELIEKNKTSLEHKRLLNLLLNKYQEIITK